MHPLDDGGPAPAPRRTPQGAGRGARPSAAPGLGALALAVSAALLAAGQAPAAVRHSTESTSWVATWEGAPVVGATGTGNPCPAGAGLADQTVRNAVFIGPGGGSVRVRLTNAFGAKALRIDHASVAVQSAGAAPVAGSLVPLTFGGAKDVTLAAGAERFSDPVALDVAALSTLLVSVHVPDATGPVTNHPFTTDTSFLAAGDATASTDPAAFSTIPCWMLVDGVDVGAPPRGAHAVVALGDSITDTAATRGGADHRWTDDLARRLQLPTGPSDRPALSVVNAGLGGNRLLAEREGQPFYGVPALDRLQRDVFEQSGVQSVIVFEGINDIGYDATADDIIGAYRNIIEQSHDRGLRVIGATLTPFRTSSIWTPARGRTWDAVNTWIRTSGTFDGVIDFAAVTARPDDPTTLDPAYDSGDGLHPNDAGTQAMADGVDLSVLSPEPVGGWDGTHHP